MTDSWDVRILTASYRRDGPQEEPVIDLLGRRRAGRSIVVESGGYKPSSPAPRPSQVLLNYRGRDSEVLKIEPADLDVKGQKTPCAKITLQHPWKTPEYRERARKHGSDVLAADIPFAHRFMYDMDLEACVRVHGTPAAGRYTTDLVVRAERFEPCEPFNPALKIVSFDIANTITEPTIQCLCVTWGGGAARGGGRPGAADGGRREAHRGRLRSQPRAGAIRVGDRPRLLVDVSFDHYRKEHMFHDPERRGDDRKPDRRPVL